MRRFLILTTAFAIAGGAAMASPCTNTLFTTTAALDFNQLLVSGSTVNTCTLDVGGYTLSNFQADPIAGYNGTGMTPLTITDNVSGGIVTFGITQGANQDVQFMYTIVPGVTTLTLGAPSGPGSVNEGVCGVPMVLPNGSCSSSISTGGTASNGALTTFAVASASEDFIFKDVNGVSEFEQIISAVPEPMTFSLMGVGLLGLGLFGRRLRKT
jgi:hypothetical protein